MELTKEEQRILDATESRLKQASKRRRWLFPVVVIGILGAAMMVVEGVRKLASGQEGYPQIACALFLAAYAGDV